MAFREDEVPDPYYGGMDGFERVLDLVEDAAQALLQARGSNAAIKKRAPAGARFFSRSRRMREVGNSIVLGFHHLQRFAGDHRRRPGFAAERLCRGEAVAAGAAWLVSIITRPTCCRDSLTSTAAGCGAGGTMMGSAAGGGIATTTGSGTTAGRGAGSTTTGAGATASSATGAATSTGAERRLRQLPEQRLDFKGAGAGGAATAAGSAANSSAVDATAVTGIADSANAAGMAASSVSVATTAPAAATSVVLPSSLRPRPRPRPRLRRPLRASPSALPFVAVEGDAGDAPFWAAPASARGGRGSRGSRGGRGSRASLGSRGSRGSRTSSGFARLARLTRFAIAAVGLLFVALCLRSAEPVRYVPCARRLRGCRGRRGDRCDRVRHDRHRGCGRDCLRGAAAGRPFPRWRPVLRPWACRSGRRAAC
jgi:hypothetical protein